MTTKQYRLVTSEGIETKHDSSGIEENLDCERAEKSTDPASGSANSGGNRCGGQMRLADQNHFEEMATYHQEQHNTALFKQAVRGKTENRITKLRSKRRISVNQ